MIQTSLHVGNLFILNLEFGIPVNDGVCVQADDQVITLLLGALQELNVTNVEQIKGSGSVDYAVRRLRWAEVIRVG